MYTIHVVFKVKFDVVVDMILNIDLRDQSEITQVHEIIHHTVPEIIQWEQIEIMDLRHENVITFHITHLHETLVLVIVTIRHLVVGTILLVDVTTKFHELTMILTCRLVVMLPGAVWAFQL